MGESPTSDPQLGGRDRPTITSVMAKNEIRTAKDIPTTFTRHHIQSTIQVKKHEVTGLWQLSNRKYFKSGSVVHTF